MAEPKHANTTHEISDDRHRVVLHFYEDEHPPEDAKPGEADTLSLDVEIYFLNGLSHSMSHGEAELEDGDPIFHHEYWLKSPGEPEGDDPILIALQQAGLAEMLAEETMRTIELFTELWDTLRHPEDAHL